MTAGDAVRERSRAIGGETPQWRPFLDLLERALSEAGSGRFDATRVERGPGARADQPFLAGARIVVPERATRRWAASVLPRRLARSRDVDVLDVLSASIGQDDGRLEAAAVVAGEDGAAVRAAAAVAALPVLFACRRVAGATPETSWTRGACPVCGAWPALSEARGLERRRRLRCGRCGADWAFSWLVCPFCGVSDHRRQGSLVPEGAADGRRVETCASCLGYLKTVSTVSALDAALVPLEDLATVAFDVDAVDRGYRRPPPAATLPCEVAGA